MRIPQDARFRDERARFGLLFCCEDCAMFDPVAERCSLEFPVEEHRLVHYEDPTVELVFCKAWQPT